MYVFDLVQCRRLTHVAVLNCSGVRVPVFDASRMETLLENSLTS